MQDTDQFAYVCAALHVASISRRLKHGFFTRACESRVSIMHRAGQAVQLREKIAGACPFLPAEGSAMRPNRGFFDRIASNFHWYGYCLDPDELIA
jgi:hypothetical protein